MPEMRLERFEVEVSDLSPDQILRRILQLNERVANGEKSIQLDNELDDMEEALATLVEAEEIEARRMVAAFHARRVFGSRSRTRVSPIPKHVTKHAQPVHH